MEDVIILGLHAARANEGPSARPEKSGAMVASQARAGEVETNVGPRPFQLSGQVLVPGHPTDNLEVGVCAYKPIGVASHAPLSTDQCNPSTHSRSLEEVRP